MKAVKFLNISRFSKQVVILGVTLYSILFYLVHSVYTSGPVTALRLPISFLIAYFPLDNGHKLFQPVK